MGFERVRMKQGAPGIPLGGWDRKIMRPGLVGISPEWVVLKKQAFSLVVCLNSGTATYIWQKLVVWMIVGQCKGGLIVFIKNMVLFVPVKSCSWVVPRVWQYPVDIWCHCCYWIYYFSQGNVAVVDSWFFSYINTWIAWGSHEKYPQAYLAYFSRMGQ